MTESEAAAAGRRPMELTVFILLGVIVLVALLTRRVAPRRVRKPDAPRDGTTTDAVEKAAKDVPHENR